MRLTELKEVKPVDSNAKKIILLQKESAEIHKKIEALRNKKAP